LNTWLVRLARRFMRTFEPMDREDAVQTILTKLLDSQTLAQVRQATSPAGYLVAMLRNAAYDLKRARGRELGGRSIEGAEGGTLAVPAWRRKRSARRRGSGRDAWRKLAPAAAAVLSEQDHDLLRAYYVQGR